MFVAAFSIFIMLLGLIMVYLTPKEPTSEKEGGPRALLFDKLYDLFSQYEREQESQTQSESDN